MSFLEKKVIGGILCLGLSQMTSESQSVFCFHILLIWFHSYWCSSSVNLFVLFYLYIFMCYKLLIRF